MDDVAIVSAIRTPLGSFLGALASVPAPTLGAVVIAEAVKRAGVRGEEVESVIMGNVLSAGLGQAPARQATLGASLSPSTAALTVNKVCGSGLIAVALAAQAIRLGEAKVVVAGGMESMSRAPYLLEKARTGYRMGDGTLVDGMIHDGLWDPYGKVHMGVYGERCAAEYRIDRKEQDEYALASYERALSAMARGRCGKEIVPVEVPGHGGMTSLVTADEGPGRLNREKLTTLPPAFAPDGTITAGNASPVSDGAAAVLLMPHRHAVAKGLHPLALLRAAATAGLPPEAFTVAPAQAIITLLTSARLPKDAVDLWEINEAFSVVALANIRLLNLDREKVNVNGGAVALGHPIGCSGARILVTLLSAMEERGARYGVAAVCLGGGEAVAVLVERPEE